MNLELIELNDEKKEYLKKIIELYIEEGIPIGSEYLIKYYNLNASSAKVRYIMNELESKYGFLEKVHTSSGRIPSSLGFQFYSEKLISYDVNEIKEKLKDLFAKRRISVDTTINEAANNISEITGLTLITTKNNIDSTLKSIQLVPLSEREATIILVTSYGEVQSKMLTLQDDKNSLEDLRIAIRIFKERLVDTPLFKLTDKVKNLIPILSRVIKNCESLIESFVNDIFEFKLVEENEVYGKNNIILANDISRNDLPKVLDLIENKSIWKTIEANIDDDQNIKIAIRPDNTAFISKKIQFNNKIKEISVVGSTRMNYEKGLLAIQMLEDLMANKK
ncbi:heat-inducible transcriptional repressor HrcA [Mycoplasmopsis hyopharyngis]|uniref:heat-inducible transcriptional repressor HrcA n=1 Tax=Mycoplasmopsis hyopharyngis TaxID=29558 RepID=UPI00387397C2